MAEIKLLQGFASEIDALESAGAAINASSCELSSDGVSSLITSMQYIEQHSKIIELLNLYGKLLAKEASDLKTMMISVQNADNAGAGGFR